MSEENFLASIPREGESVEDVLNSVDKELQETKEDTKVETKEPAESLPEKLELPDESILKKNEAWEEMRKTNEALQARLEALEKEESVEKSEFVSSLVGDNQDVEAKWAKEKMSLKEEMKRELIQEQIDAQKKEQEQTAYWRKWTDERLSEVEKEFKVDFKADESKRNELSKIMLDYSPTDEQGNLDYRKGMKILEQLSKVKEQEEANKTQTKKNIADATVSKETSVKKNKDYYTSHDFRGKDWRQMIQED